MLAAAGLHLAYLAHDCPLDMVPDEAHYWDWSRHLDWSYYSKGPGIAWLIRLSCELFGGLSIALTGGEMLAVRLPALVCGSLLLTSLYVLAVQVSGRHRPALAVVAVALTTPVIAAGSSLMTIDAPYCCCWGWALVFAHRAVFGGSRPAWAVAGVLTGWILDVYKTDIDTGWHLNFYLFGAVYIAATVVPAQRRPEARAVPTNTTGAIMPSTR